MAYPQEIWQYELLRVQNTVFPIIEIKEGLGGKKPVLIHVSGEMTMCKTKINLKYWFYSINDVSIWKLADLNLEISKGKLINTK